jgi:hypothetical protein
MQEAFAARQHVVLSQLGSLVDFHAALLGEFFDVKAILFYTVQGAKRARIEARGGRGRARVRRACRRERPRSSRPCAMLRMRGPTRSHRRRCARTGHRRARGAALVDQADR